MKENSAPKPGCNCAVCNWANRRIERERDLEVNYARYQAGKLVIPDAKE